MTARTTSEKLRDELAAIVAGDRLAYLADLPASRLAEFKRIMPPEDIRALNAFIDRRLRERAKPTVASWLAEARAGRTTSVDAMVDVLREVADRLRPQDATWLKRITEDAPGGNYSRRQAETLRSIYARYFVPHTDGD
ncbi:MAG: hypothetical protein KC983_07020 [Phycisphaerales bacterium]|nr:hypothetical protein [Phycisphaerales bacterium]